MKLYHGTSIDAAQRALVEGLKPRALTGRSNWDHSLKSNKNCVYLTECYAPYFAAAASPESDWGIVEVDSELLENSKFLPDEDGLEQISRLQSQSSKSTMLSQTRFFRQNLADYQDLWEDVLNNIGNCCFMGTIPPAAITKIVTIDKSRLHPSVRLMATDPSISVMNHRFCADKYRALTEWCMLRSVEIERLLMLPKEMLPLEMLSQDKEAFSDSSAISVLFSRDEISTTTTRELKNHTSTKKL